MRVLQVNAANSRSNSSIEIGGLGQPKLGKAMTDARFVSTVRDYSQPTLRQQFRHGVVSSLAAWQQITSQQVHGLNRARTHFLVLHSVFHDEEKNFRELLRRLSINHSFISYSEAVRRVCAGNVEAPAVTFSFDDGMKNNVSAARILDEFGAKACFFVCSEIVGEKDFDRLARFCRKQLRSPPVEFLDWRDIDKLLTAGHEIGSHTRTHPNLAELDEGSIDHELEGSLLELKKRIGGVKHLAWPYGRFENVPKNFGWIAERNGYESCASAVRGCHVKTTVSNPQSLCLRREQVSAGWPVEHSLYFLADSANRATAADNDWPHELQS